MSRHGEPPLSPEFILSLQKSAGNRAVQRILAARAMAAAPPPAILLPPDPPPIDEPPPVIEAEVVTVIPSRAPGHWWVVIAHLILWLVGWTEGRLRLKGKTEDGHSR